LTKRRMLVQMEETMYDQLVGEVYIQRMRGNRRASIAAIIREAVALWLEGRSEGLRDKRVTLKGKVKR